MAYKVFANGFPLPASDLNNYLMNQSVIVFADSAARSAALTSPIEGMVTYLESTNTIEVWTGAAWTGVGGTPITTQGDLIVGNSSGLPARLAIGANNTVLTSNGTTATWTAPAATGSSWTSISTGNITTGASTFILNSLPSYDKYMLLISGLSSTAAAAAVTLRINSDSGSNYKNAGMTIYGFTTYSPDFFQGTSSFATTAFSLGEPDTATSVFAGSISIEGGKSSGAKSVTYIGSGNNGGTGTHSGQLCQGIWNNSAVVSSLRLAVDQGTIDAGTYELWGSN